MLNTESLNYAQLKILVAHANADQVILSGMSRVLFGAGGREAFDVLNNLAYVNVVECVGRLAYAGVDVPFEDVAANFAERIAHYFPEIEEKTQRLADHYGDTRMLVALSPVEG